ncbi:MAG TPA: tRNA pseudouridine(55) synthase TruB [Gemmatimonadales bacterium]|nr:tRNA pseudouridine(55) synthase TruB [Gemmatimonadales bacterium]
MLIAKRPGPTSHDVVDVARRALGETRVGHLGTLDPFAQGLLVLVVGRATRLARFASSWLKGYEGVIRLGAQTTTDDVTGAVVATSEAWRALGEADVIAALGEFEGEHAQRPPAYSAVKVGGERAYRRARRGEEVTLEPRTVAIHTLALESLALPDVRFRATVTAGTYLRSLARDVGERLGCGGHLAALTRTAVGPFRLADAVPPEAATWAALRSPATLVDGLARRQLDDAERMAVVHGRPIPAGDTPADRAVALFAGEELVAVAERAGDALKPRVVVADQ